MRTVRTLTKPRNGRDRGCGVSSQCRRHRAPISASTGLQRQPRTWTLSCATPHTVTVEPGNRNGGRLR